ncbi:MAG: 6-phosphogluconolactonase [Lachnospirales bacterium]
MEIRILQDAKETGKFAGEKAGQILIESVQKQGKARFMAATGQSQLYFYESLLSQNIPWDKIEIFHLDEYCGLPSTHTASFQKYIKERFISNINPMKVHFIDGTKNIDETLATLNKEAHKDKIDLGMIGFGENAHIAFNDPPADFNCKDSYHLVNLDEKCRQQQVNEGWFSSIDEVPKQAISASVPFIKSFENIVSLIPYSAKASAVKKVMESQKENINIPGTALIEHKRWFIYFDHESTSLLDLSKIKHW